MENFETIYRRYAGTVKKYLMSLGADYDLSDDITSETFYKALKKINTYDEKQKMLTWLCTIAKRTYFDHLKKKDNNNVPMGEFDFEAVYDHRSPEAETESKEQRRLIYKNILLLENPQRDVLYMRLFADLSFKEIGEIFSKNENWARVTFYRAKTKLKELLDNEI